MDKMTMRVPKLPFDLYSVYDGFKETELESVTVVRITPTKWWFGERENGRRYGGLAFHCRTGCSPFAYPLTARAAWQTFRANAIEARDDADRQVQAAEKAIAQLGRG